MLSKSAVILQNELIQFKNWIVQHDVEDKLKSIVIGRYQPISDMRQLFDFLNSINSHLKHSDADQSFPADGLGYYISTNDFLEDINKAFALDSDTELRLWANAWHEVINSLLLHHGESKSNLSSYVSSFKSIYNYNKINKQLLDSWYDQAKYIAKHLKIFLNTKPWHFAGQAKLELMHPKENSYFIDDNPSLEQIKFVEDFYANSFPDPNYTIESIKVIYNKSHINIFNAHLYNMQQNHNNPNLVSSDAPISPYEIKKALILDDIESKDRQQWRENTRQRWLKLKAFNEPYKDPSYPGVTILRLWNGHANVQSAENIARNGYAHVKEKTDQGYYGKGFYFTAEAGYASKYGKVLILSCVSVNGVLPVIENDKKQLYGRGTPNGFSATYTPVIHIKDLDFDSPPQNIEPDFSEVASFVVPPLPQFIIKLTTKP